MFDYQDSRVGGGDNPRVASCARWQIEEEDDGGGERLKYSQLASARTTARGKKREPGIPKGSERATDGRGDLFERFERATDCVPHSQESSSSIWTRLGLAGVNIWKLSWLKCPRRRMRSGSFRFICHFPPPIGTRTLCWVANTTHTH